MSDFKAKLEQRKMEMLASKTSTSESTVNERAAAQLDSFMYKTTRFLKNALIGAAIVSLLLTWAIVKDWWTFLGTPEYSQYKQRIEREK